MGKEPDQSRVLIVDDEPEAIEALSSILRMLGYLVFQSHDVDKAIRILDKEEVDAVITDMKMPGKNGMHLFEHIQDRFPDLPVIFLTADSTVDSAVHTMSCGVFYYFVKPADCEKLRAVLAQAIERHQFKRSRKTAKSHGIVSASPQMRKILEDLDDIKDSMSSVLVRGETGAGKELIARALHFSSVRKKKPFVALNCAAIPKNLIESELFGYEKGAFSGAASRRIGRCEEAGEGTLFLDEIGELDFSLQAKLLRVLQEREMERIGSNTRIKVGFRLVSSTNRDLKKEVAAGNFREDLFYRLNVVEIVVPPLRERREDITVLLEAFVREFSLENGKQLAVSEDVERLLLGHPWPGNIRQLRNVVERAVVLAKGNRITAQHLPEEFRDGSVTGGGGEAVAMTLRERQGLAIQDVLRECGGNKSSAAKMLGISRKSFYHRLKSVEADPATPEDFSVAKVAPKPALRREKAEKRE